MVQLSNYIWHKWPLAIKLTLTSTLLIVGVVVVLTLLAIQREQYAFRSELEQQAEVLLITLAVASADPLYTLDTDALSDLVEGLGAQASGAHQQILASGRIYDARGRIVGDANDPFLAFNLESDPFGQQLVNSNSTVFVWGPDQLIAGQAVIVGNQRLGAVSVGLSTDLLQAKVAAARDQGITTALVAIAVGALLTLLLSRSVTGPLRAIVGATQRIIETGDLNQKITIQNADEIGVLAVAFNAMISQLRQTIGGLEQRVAERTRALELSMEVGRHLSRILDKKQLVAEVVKQVQAAFNYYYVQIYLFDDKRENLVLASGTGEAGRAMLVHDPYLARAHGLVGRAAEINAIVLVPNVSLEPGWLPNPLLPETQAEVAVPIAIGDEVLGVLDVQHHLQGGLTQADADLIQFIAHQVAIALQNARTYARAKQQAEREVLVNTIGQRIQDATTVDQAMQIAVRELGRVLETGYTQVRLNISQPANGQ